MLLTSAHTEKKKMKFSSYIRKFRVEQLQSHMRMGFLIYEEMRKYFPIYEEAVSHIWIWNSYILNFPIYEEKFYFVFSSMHLKKYAYPLLQLVRPTMAQGSSSEYLLTGMSIFRPFYQTILATFC